MKQVSLSKRIKSKFIFNLIFDYIKDAKFKMKLFLYSKSFQKHLGLNLLDYQEVYFNKIGINFYNYLKYNEDNNDNSNVNFDKKYLEKKLEEELSKYNKDLKDVQQKIITNYFKKNKFKKNKNNNKIIEKCFYNYKNGDNNIYDNYNNLLTEIDIYSPLFDILSNNKEIFEKFSIVVPFKYFKKYELKNDYTSTFDKLNQLQSKYSSITIYINDNDDINELKNININFNQIQKLAINIDGDELNYDNFFEVLLSSNIKNSLIYLFLNKKDFGKLDDKTFHKLNNFSNIEHLSLNGINFKQIFKLKLSKLKILSLYKCENIILEKVICSNLKKLYLHNSNICYNSYPQIKLPKVEECELIDKNSEVSHYNLLIDFSSFKSLKTLKLEDSDFFKLENISLDNLTIYNHSFIKRTINYKLDISDKIIIKKIISMNSLKKVNFYLNIIKENTLNNNEMNTSITEMKLHLQKHKIDFILNLQNKFPNLSKLALLYDPDFYLNDNEKELEIKEDEKYYINNIKLIAGISDVILYCGRYENLIKINIECYNKIKNIRNILPVFGDKCDVIFNNLTYFRFIYHPKEGINSDILDNLYNNIDKLPKLKFFEFICTTLDGSEDFYKKFKQKLINMSLEKFSLTINTSNDKP